MNDMPFTALLSAAVHTNMTSHRTFFLENLYKLMSKWLRRVAVSPMQPPVTGKTWTMFFELFSAFHFFGHHVVQKKAQPFKSCPVQRLYKSPSVFCHWGAPPLLSWQRIAWWFCARSTVCCIQPEHLNLLTIYWQFSHCFVKKILNTWTHCVYCSHVVIFMAILSLIPSLEVQGVLYDSYSASVWANQAKCLHGHAHSPQPRLFPNPIWRCGRHMQK